MIWVLVLPGAVYNSRLFRLKITIANTPKSFSKSHPDNPELESLLTCQQ